MRGKVYGLLQLTQPLGYLIGMVVALVLGEHGCARYTTSLARWGSCWRW